MNNDYSPTQDQFRRLLVSLLDLPQAAPDNAEVALVLEVVDMALHTPPACAERMLAMGYFAQQARHLLGLTSVADLQQLLDQFPQTPAGDQQVAQLLWQRPEVGNVWALRLLVWFVMSYNVAEPGAWLAWQGTAGFEEALRERLDELGAVAAVLLWQARSGRSDHAWVMQFLRRELDADVPDGVAMLAFREIAHALGEPELQLARRVARFERMALGVDDVPAMRIWWWECVARQLREALAVQKDEEGGAEQAASDWHVALMAADVLRHGAGGLTAEPVIKWLTRSQRPTLAALRFVQQEWGQGFALALVIDGEGRLPVDVFDGIVSRFEAAGLRPPVLQFTGERTWQASWEWDESALIPKQKVAAEVQRWARDTAMRVAEHWLLLAGVLGVGQAPRTRKASNEKRF